MFAANGVGGLLITTAVIGKQKIERAVRLSSQRHDTIFCVDNAQNVRDLNDAAGVAHIKMNVAVDLFIAGRTGIQPGEPALGLAQLIDSLPNLKLAGIQAYAGQASHVIGWEERRKVSQAAMGRAVETARLFEKNGIECPLLTGGSTGTYNIDSEIKGISELQPGSFMFMDVDYSRIGGKDGGRSIGILGPLYPFDDRGQQAIRQPGHRGWRLQGILHRQAVHSGGQGHPGNHLFLGRGRARQARSG